MVGLSPKLLKLRKDFEEEEMEALFGPCIIRNKYKHSYSNDKVLIVNEERLWMITRQRIRVPNTQFGQQSKSTRNDCLMPFVI